MKNREARRKAQASWMNTNLRKEIVLAKLDGRDVDPIVEWYHTLPLNQQCDKRSYVIWSLRNARQKNASLMAAIQPIPHVWHANITAEAWSKVLGHMYESWEAEINRDINPPIIKETNLEESNDTRPKRYTSAPAQRDPFADGGRGRRRS